jgi:hypothetical protein
MWEPVLAAWASIVLGLSKKARNLTQRQSQGNLGERGSVVSGEKRGARATPLRHGA